MKKVYIVVSSRKNENGETELTVCGVFLNRKQAEGCFFSIIGSQKYFDDTLRIKIEEKYLEEPSPQENMNAFINILENKQTENQEGVEEFTEDTFENGWQSAFNVAILLVKEHPELFK